ncbi:hypothetical protein Ddc_11370 [Ditylenchus destructor]|nr:hypothetical protein Ddc_11370 [Ditylenchus destructor]
MRKSARLAERHANLVNDACKEPNAKKNKFNNKTSKIATMDNGTIVEAFKYLDYCQLAKKSLVSKRFRNVIQTHRYSLPLLRVKNLMMERVKPTELDELDYELRIFWKELSAEEYDEWIIRNHYSKQVPLEGQVVQKESTQNDCDVYYLSAAAYYEGSNDCYKSTTVINVAVEFNHEHWPLFQHFVRLLSDPFVRISQIDLVDQNDVMNLLVEAIKPDRDRLQCDLMYFNHQGNLHKFINWIKDRFCCDELNIFGNTDSNHDQELLHFSLTGAHCSSTVNVHFDDFSKVVVDFVKKFLDLKNGDEYQLVQGITNREDDDEECRVVQVLKREYPKCFVKEERTKKDSTLYYFKFNNGNIAKKMQLTVEHYERYDAEIDPEENSRGPRTFTNIFTL